jgi:hypothetical protein
MVVAAGIGARIELGAGTGRCGRHARFTTAVVEAAEHDGAFDVAFDEVEQHLLPDARDVLLAHASTGPALRHAHPAAAAVVGPGIGTRGGLPMELDADAAEGVGVQLIGTVR